MIAVPGETDAETLAALIADEVAIGVINHKTTAVRVIPVPGKGAGDRAVFGGLFGETAILPVHAAGGSTAFVHHGGRIPAPLSSLRNSVGITLVGGTGDQLRENSRLQKASHWPFSLR
jgi:uncharacterized protein (UPF0210 family)